MIPALSLLPSLHTLSPSRKVCRLQTHRLCPQKIDYPDLLSIKCWRDVDNNNDNGGMDIEWYQCVASHPSRLFNSNPTPSPSTFECGKLIPSNRSSLNCWLGTTCPAIIISSPQFLAKEASEAGSRSSTLITINSIPIPSRSLSNNRPFVHFKNQLQFVLMFVVRYVNGWTEIDLQART